VYFTRMIPVSPARSINHLYLFINNLLHYKLIQHVPVFLILSYIILFGIYLLYSKKVLQIALLIG